MCIVWRQRTAGTAFSLSLARNHASSPAPAPFTRCAALEWPSVQIWQNSKTSISISSVSAGEEMALPPVQGLICSAREAAVSVLSCGVALPVAVCNVFSV